METAITDAADQASAYCQVILFANTIIPSLLHYEFSNVNQLSNYQAGEGSVRNAHGIMLQEVTDDTCTEVDPLTLRKVTIILSTSAMTNFQIVVGRNRKCLQLEICKLFYRWSILKWTRDSRNTSLQLAISIWFSFTGNLRANRFHAQDYQTTNWWLVWRQLDLWKESCETDIMKGRPLF